MNSRLIALARKAACAAGLSAIGVLAVSPGIAGATSRYVWSGTDSLAGTNSDWSDSGNWLGAAAPATGTPDDLHFPALACGATCNAGAYNDLTGLVVPTLTMQLKTQSSMNADYNVTGSGVTVGTLDVTSDTPTSAGGQSGNLNIPLTLRASEQWSIDAENGSNFNLGAVTGRKAQTLQVSLPVANGDNGGGFVGVPSWETGPLSFTGLVGDNSSYVTGATSFNGTTDQPVSFSQTDLFETSPGGTTAKAVTVKYGPLSVSSTTVFFGNGSGGPYGIDSVDGAATLDSATNLNFNSLDPGTKATPAAGLSYPQLKATGLVTLGSANLGLFAACGQKLGKVYTIVSAGAVSGTFQNLPNDTIFQANGDGSSSCTNGSPTWFEINYGPSTVTLTVVSPPPGPRSVRHQTATLVPHVAASGVRSLQRG
jgi:hypothetical protein